MFRKIHLPILLMAAFLAYWISESVRYGDAPYYAQEITRGTLIEPGHLLWRPLGAFLYSILQLLGYTGDALWVIQGLSLVASVAAVAAMFFFLSKWCSRGLALWGAGLFAFSNGFWFYAISGCAYSLSVFFIVMALNFATPSKDSPTHSLRRALLSGTFGGLAALSWLVQGLNLPSLLLSNIFFHGSMSKPLLKHLVKATTIFLTGYFITLGLPMLGAYFGVRLLDPKLYSVASPESIGFLSWVMSASHGIPTTFGLLRPILGWSQSVLTVGDLGTHVRLWLLVDTGSMEFPIAPGSLSLVIFYLSVLGALWLIWRRRATLLINQRMILAVGACSLLANFIFGLCWQATDLERYLPSIPFLVLGFCFAIDRSLYQSKAIRTLAGLTTIGTVLSVNWFGTFYPALATNSYKQQWLAAIGRHMHPKDLLIVLGSKKNELVDPHNTGMPRIGNISMLISMGRTAWKPIVLKWIRETIERGGRVMVGDSVLGLDPRPRDGWSFKEYTKPSPKDLDEFFGLMKADLVFSTAGERVWLTKFQLNNSP